MMDQTSFFLIALIFLLVGFALGSLVSFLRRDKETPAPSQPSGLVEALRLWRHPGKAQLVPEMDGHTFRRSDDLSVEQFNRLMQVMKELRTWMGMPETPLPSRLRESRSETGLGDLSIGRPGVQVKPGLGQELPVSVAADADKVKRVSFNPVDIFARAISSETPLPSHNKSIAAQIDEILQEKLESSPYKDRGIRLMELPGKGMVVMVGLNQYDGVDSVPDDEIRALIRSCVTEWEQRIGD